jgi:hypothetical protein
MERQRWNVDLVEGPLRKRIRHVAHEDRLMMETTAPGDDLVAAAVRERQASGERFQGLNSFAGDWLCIPAGVWMEATRANPELTSTDTETRTRALKRWAAGPGRLWRVRTEREYVRGGLKA